MNKSGADSYIWGKTAGMLVKSFTGSNAQKLFAINKLTDLWAAIFNTDAPQLPEILLANRIEYEAVKRLVSQYSSLLQFYDKPNVFLIELLRRYEIENLKVMAAAVSMHEEKRPRIIKLGKYAVLNYDAWPNIHEVTAGTQFSWYHDAKDVITRQQLDYHLDLQEVKTLHNALDKISDDSHDLMAKYFEKVYSLKNMLWALRLRVYYKFDAGQVTSNLFYVGDEAVKGDPLCRWAFEVIDRDIDNFNDWKDWRFAKYLNEYSEGEAWTINPMVVEQKLKVVENKAARSLFHKAPMSVATLAMFFKIKQQELDCIRAATERIRLGFSSSEAASVVGIA